ncbi:hypothetical protein ACE6H2_016918 [Prunus campanulata]
MVLELDPDQKCASEEARPQGRWIVRLVSWGNKNGEQSHIARGRKGESGRDTKLDDNQVNRGWVVYDISNLIPVNYLPLSPSSYPH